MPATDPTPIPADDPTDVEMIRAATEVDFRLGLDCSNADELRMIVAAMAGRTHTLALMVEQADARGRNVARSAALLADANGRLRSTLSEIAAYADERATATEVLHLLHAALGSIANTARRAARIAENCPGR